MSSENPDFSVHTFNYPRKAGNWVKSDAQFMDALASEGYGAVSLRAYVYSETEGVPDVVDYINSAPGREQARHIAAKQKGGNKKAKAAIPECEGCGHLMHIVTKPDEVPSPADYASTGLVLPDRKPDKASSTEKAAKKLFDNAASASYVIGNAPPDVHFDLLPVTVESEEVAAWRYWDDVFYNFNASLYNLKYAGDLDKGLADYRKIVALHSFNSLRSDRLAAGQIASRLVIDQIEGGPAKRAIYGYDYALDDPGLWLSTKPLRSWVDANGGELKALRTSPSVKHLPESLDPSLALYRQMHDNGVEVLPQATEELPAAMLQVEVAACLLTVLHDKILPLPSYDKPYWKKFRKNMRRIAANPDMVGTVLEAYSAVGDHKEDDDTSLAQTTVRELIDWKLAVR